MFSHREQTLFFFERTWWSQLQVTHALIQPERSCYGEPVLLRKMLALWSGLTSTRLQKACIKLLWASVLIWGLKRCKVRARLLMLDDSLLLGVPNGEGWLHRPADYSLDAVVLQPISVLNETLVIEVHIPVGLARVCIYSHYFFLPSIFFFLWLAVVGTVCLLLPSQNSGIFSWPPLLALCVHLVSLKLCGLLCLPSSKHSFTYQAVENSGWIQYNRSTEWCSSLDLRNKMVPSVLMGLWIFRTRLVSAHCMYPISCECKKHCNCH